MIEISSPDGLFWKHWQSEEAFNAWKEELCREARNKAIDDACNTITRLSADGELAGCSSDFILSFASDLVQSLKEG